MITVNAWCIDESGSHGHQNIEIYIDDIKAIAARNNLLVKEVDWDDIKCDKITDLERELEEKEDEVTDLQTSFDELSELMSDKS